MGDADLGASGHDLTPGPPDLRHTGLRCVGDVVCKVGEICCGQTGSPSMYRCEPTCAMGATIHIACDGPEDCGGATPLCCGRLGLGPGSFPECRLNSLVSTCEAQCAAAYMPQCAMDARLRRCHTSADCESDVFFPYCCEFADDEGVIDVCVDDLLKLGARRCHD